MFVQIQTTYQKEWISLHECFKETNQDAEGPDGSCGPHREAPGRGPQHIYRDLSTTGRQRGEQTLTGPRHKGNLENCFTGLTASDRPRDQTTAVRGPGTASSAPAAVAWVLPATPAHTVPGKEYHP